MIVLPRLLQDPAGHESGAHGRECNDEQHANGLHDIRPPKRRILNRRGYVVFLLAAHMVLAWTATASPVYGFDKWSKTEMVMEVLYITLHMIDWGQSLCIADDETYFEYNPCLGRHPSRRRVNVFFGAGLIFQPLVAHILPHRWRKAWIATGIVLEAGCVGNNHSLGIRVTF